MGRKAGVANNGDGSARQPVSPADYVGVIIGVYWVGTQPATNTKKEQREIRFLFELFQNDRPVREGGYVRTIAANVSADTLDTRSTLVRIAGAVRGRNKYTEAEIATIRCEGGLNVEAFLERAVCLRVIPWEKPDGSSTTVIDSKSYRPLGPGKKPPVPNGDSQYWDETLGSPCPRAAQFYWSRALDNPNREVGSTADDDDDGWENNDEEEDVPKEPERYLPGNQRGWGLLNRRPPTDETASATSAANEASGEDAASPPA